jgi:hypothetical protein
MTLDSTSPFEIWSPILYEDPQSRSSFEWILTMLLARVCVIIFLIEFICFSVAKGKSFWVVALPRLCSLGRKILG